ncbi:hypothetical protein X731_02995 [Mesorhizobium sp. L2C054A000]|nr:hypothetical protein X731_02995 [Mesorhizobium sp. L2C054A000]
MRPFAVTSVEAIPWKRGSLFVGQPDRKQAVARVPAERPPNDASSAPTVRDVSAIVPLSEGLFVARAGEGIQP